MIKLEIQKFGGRGASSGSTGVSGGKVSDSMKVQLAREVTGDRSVSNERMVKYFNDNLRYVPDGAVLSDYADWEINKSTGEWTKQGIQNRITYLTKGYDAARKEGQKFQREYEKRNKKK